MGKPCDISICVLPVGQLAANCYLVFEEESREALIIDPGDEADFIISKIYKLELAPTKIIATHTHFDHIMAVNELKLAFNIPFLIHKKDKVLLRWMRRSALHFTKVDPGPPPKEDQFLKELDLLEVGGCKLKVLATPGHTPGGISLYCKDKKIVFVGDMIFKGGGVGRTDLPYSNKADLEKSIKKLLTLPKETIVYPGHGEKFTIQK